MIRLSAGRWCRVHHDLRRFRHHDPRNDVGEYAASTEQGDNQPQHAHNRDVQIEVPCNARAQAEYLYYLHNLQKNVAILDEA